MAKKASKRKHPAVQVGASQQQPSARIMTVADWRDAFHRFDQDGDGVISWAELKLVCSSRGMPFSSAEIDDMMQHADGDGDQRITEEEFLKMAREGSLAALTARWCEAGQSAPAQSSRPFEPLERQRISVVTQYRYDDQTQAWVGCDVEVQLADSSFSVSVADSCNPYG